MAAGEAGPLRAGRVRAPLTPTRRRPAQLRRVAAEAGIGPDDPLAPLVDELSVTVEALSKLPGDCGKKFDAVDARLSAILDKAEALAGMHIARQAALEIPKAVDRVVRMRYWWLAVLFGVMLACAACGGYWYGEMRRDEQVGQIRAGLDLALNRNNAEIWLALMRMNQADNALENCRPVPQNTGGEACSFVLWTRLPPAPPAR